MENEKFIKMSARVDGASMSIVIPLNEFEDKTGVYVEESDFTKDEHGNKSMDNFTENEIKSYTLNELENNDDTRESLNIDEDACIIYMGCDLVSNEDICLIDEDMY